MPESFPGGGSVRGAGGGPGEAARQLKRRRQRRTVVESGKRNRMLDSHKVFLTTEYITASLIREFLMIAVFRMLDPLLFYVLPESVLIPMLCGAEHLLFAGIKLFLCRGLVQ
ncbi:hypothetical protein HN51_000012 [Arachis hypogaea]